MKIAKTSDQSGFSILEVMISIMLFAAFFTVFHQTMGTNVIKSKNMSEELTLHLLCEQIINDLIVNPPPLTKSLVVVPETKSFEEEQYANFQYTIEYQEFEVPNFFEMTQAAEGEAPSSSNSAIMQTVFKKVQENIKKIIWQVKVTVAEKESGREYSLSTWLKNRDAQINLGIPGASPSSN